MTIVTQKDFRRVHNNGSVLVEVPKGTQIKVEEFYSSGAWTITAEKPVTKQGEKVFRVNRHEYTELVGA